MQEIDHEGRPHHWGFQTHGALLAAALLSSMAIGCGDDEGGGGDGNLSVVLEAEETIPEGLQNGTGEENIMDGFDVSYSRYIIVVGLVEMSQLDGENRQASDAVAVADFTRLPTTLPELTRFDGIPIGQYTSFGFATPSPDDGVINVNEVDEDDVAAMIENGWSYIIEGQLRQVSDGATRDFLIEADVPSVYSDCAVEDLEPGVNVGMSSSASITMHGDHLFFNGFPADESSVVRLAQWMWDVPDDGDGVLTREDFEAATDVGTLFPSPTYSLDGGPLPITNAWDFVRAELGTQGHIFGEGECEWDAL